MLITMMCTWAEPGVEKDASSHMWKLSYQGIAGLEEKFVFLLLYSKVRAVSGVGSRITSRVPKCFAHVKVDVI